MSAEFPVYTVRAREWTIREEDGRPCYIVERWFGKGTQGQRILTFTYREDAERVAGLLMENAPFEVDSAQSVRP